MPEHDRQASTTPTAAEPPAEAQLEARGGAAELLLGLQRTAGNAAVNALLQRRRRGVQRTPLIESDYFSLSQLRKVVSIKQTPKYLNYGGLNEVPAQVEVSVADFEGSNVLSMGTVGQAEIEAASEAGWQAQAALAASHPELVWHKSALEGIRRISFVRRNVSGSAIKKIADLMAANITKRGSRPNTTARTKEGIANMFLHVFGQAIITTIWGRAAADLSGDIHERDQPALIVGGKLTAAQERQAIDNYCDMVNNVHGQTWGEQLSDSLGVDDDTVWTPVTVALYANELQKLIAKSLGWEMQTIPGDHPEVVKFSNMLNEVVHGTLPPEVDAGAATAAAAAANNTANAR